MSFPMNGALTILKIRTYDKSFEDAVAVSAVPEVTAKFQEDIETYQLHDYFIRGKNRAGGQGYLFWFTSIGHSLQITFSCNIQFTCFILYSFK